MKEYTITVRCGAYGTLSEYKVKFPSKAAIKRYFADKPDKLLAIENGWGDFHQWCCELLRKTRLDKPKWNRKHRGPWKEQKPYDYKTDMKGHEY